jgi:glycosyl transferase family 2
VRDSLDPYLSVIVELDNVRHGEGPRARIMFARLLEQIRQIPELHGRVEILIPYDQRGVDRPEIESVVGPLTGHDGLSLELVPTDGLRYYQLKNEGGRRARGELILFVDSDVLPEETWLRRLLDSFTDPEREVVAANSYVDRDTFYAKTFALGWYFPARLPDGPLIEQPTTYVNTIAMRRHIFEKHPFPEDVTLYMDQGLIWAQGVNRNGIRTFLNPGARVAHPPPHFLRSAFINGYDLAMRTPQPGESKLGSFRRTYWGFRENLREASGRIRRGYREVGLSRTAVPFALALAGTYWMLWGVAELTTRWAPGLIPHRYMK